MATADNHMVEIDVSNDDFPSEAAMLASARMNSSTKTAVDIPLLQKSGSSMNPLPDLENL